MKETKMITGVIIEEINCIEFCHQYNIPKSLLYEMIDEGLLSAKTKNLKDIALDERDANRIRTAVALNRDLRINLPGVALAIELMEEMEALQKELEILRRQFFV